MSDFNDFWKIYPVKLDKKTALRAWNTAVKKKPPAEIIAAVQKYVIWSSQKGEWRPRMKYPATWLNGECWDNEMEVKTAGVRNIALEIAHSRQRIADELAYRSPPRQVAK